MRFGEFLPWIIVTFSTLIFIKVVSPRNWPERTRRAFHFVLTAGFFLMIGAYWLSTGEKFDETAYRWVLCRIYPFARCSAVAPAAARDDLRERLEQQIENLKRETDALKRRQDDAQEAKRQEEVRAKANAVAKPVPLPSLSQEGPQMSAIKPVPEPLKPLPYETSNTRKSPIVHDAEKIKLYVVTFAYNGKLESPPYSGGTVRQDYSGYAGILLRDYQGKFEIRLTDVKVGGLGGLRHECTGGQALSDLRVGDVVRMKPGNCTMLTDTFVPGTVFAP
jgi:hypothetical protein